MTPIPTFGTAPASANDGFSPSDKKRKTKISPERVEYLGFTIKTKAMD
jgi:hypothetical protein